MCGELQHFFGYSTPSAGGNFTPHLSTSLFSWFHFQFIENSGLECCESNKQLNWCITHFSIQIRTSLANNNLRLKMKMKIFQFDVCAFMDHFIQTATVPTKINQPLPHWLDSLTIPFLSFMNDFGSFCLNSLVVATLNNTRRTLNLLLWGLSTQTPITALETYQTLQNLYCIILTFLALKRSFYTIFKSSVHWETSATTSIISLKPPC